MDGLKAWNCPRKVTIEAKRKTPVKEKYTYSGEGSSEGIIKHKTGWEVRYWWVSECQGIAIYHQRVTYKKDWCGHRIDYPKAVYFRHISQQGEKKRMWIKTPENVNLIPKIYDLSVAQQGQTTRQLSRSEKVRGNLIETKNKSDRDLRRNKKKRIPNRKCQQIGKPDNIVRQKLLGGVVTWGMVDLARGRKSNALYTSHVSAYVSSVKSNFRFSAVRQNIPSMLAHWLSRTHKITAERKEMNSREWE